VHRHSRHSRFFVTKAAPSYGTGAFMNMVEPGTTATISAQPVRSGDLIFADNIGAVTIPGSDMLI